MGRRIGPWHSQGQESALVACLRYSRSVPLRPIRQAHSPVTITVRVFISLVLQFVSDCKRLSRLSFPCTCNVRSSLGGMAYVLPTHQP